MQAPTDPNRRPTDPTGLSFGGSAVCSCPLCRHKVSDSFSQGQLSTVDRAPLRDKFVPSEALPKVQKQLRSQVVVWFQGEALEMCPASPP
mmetsp:Transcript_13738/g.24513  ORF Transcript_13738/g.24513 Transcript_13738/m.24513 type:complete len:90 (+) Transcript_13738:93-362(+)